MLTKYNYNQLFLGAAAIAAAGLGAGLIQPALSHADTLVWTGAAGATGSATYGSTATAGTSGTTVATANWDGTSANWNDSTSGATGVAYTDGSNVTFNGTGANTNVTINNVSSTGGGGVTPGSVAFTGGSASYQFFPSTDTALAAGGYQYVTGIQGSGSLTLASGFTGTVTMASVSTTSYSSYNYHVTTTSLNNPYTGGTFIDGGTLSAGTIGGSVSASSSGGPNGPNVGTMFGTGAITFGGTSGTLNIATQGTGDYGPALENNLVVTAGSTGTINMGPRQNVGVNAVGATSTTAAIPASTVTGSGTLNLGIQYVRDELAGNWAGFTGTLNLNATNVGGATGADLWFAGYSSNPSLRGIDIGGTLNLNGTAASPVEVGNIHGNFHSFGFVFQLGGLEGTQNSTLLGSSYAPSSTNNYNLEYVVGADNANTTFGGKMAGAAGQTTDFYKVGSGSLTVSSTAKDSFGGMMEVNSGTLVFDGGMAPATTSVQVDAPGVAITTIPNNSGAPTVTLAAGTGGTLAGTGTINTVVNNNGILMPGDPGVNSGIGTLTISANTTAPVSSTNLTTTTTPGGTVTNNGTLMINLGSAGKSSLLAITAPTGGLGNLALGSSSVLDLVNTGGAFDGSTYTIATFTGTLSGTFASIIGLAPTYKVNYNANSITLSGTAPVPEPATLGLFGIAGLGLLLLRKRKTA